MKPRNKLEKRVMEGSATLRPLSLHTEQLAIRAYAPHLAKRDSKGVYHCLECGQSWKGAKGDKAKKVVCPHCHTKLEVDDSRKRAFSTDCYFATTEACGEFQVIRTFMLFTHLQKGKMADWWIGEAIQRWISPGNKDVVLSRNRPYLCWTKEVWDWFSPLSIKNDDYLRQVQIHELTGRRTYTAELKRNGFEGNSHGIEHSLLFHQLLNSSGFETLWKMKRFDLIKYFVKSPSSLGKYWPSLKIALRHGYKVEDVSLWVDMLQDMTRLGADIKNPSLICPKDLKSEHDKWMTKRQRHEEKLRKLRQEEESRRHEEEYKKSKSQFFDIELTDDEITVKPLTSVKEFVQEAQLMHHCVYSGGYYKREKCLILHAVVGTESIATIELNLETFAIVQCRGRFNKVPEHMGRITKLIEDNISIFQKITSKTKAA